MWWTKTVWERLAAGVALARLRRHPLPLQTQQSQTLAEAPAALAGRSGWIIEIVYDTLCHTLHPGRKSPHERQGFYCSLNWLQVPVDAAERDSMRPQGTPSQLAVRPSRRRHVAGSRRERLRVRPEVCACGSSEWPGERGRYARSDELPRMEMACTTGCGSGAVCGVWALV